MSGSSVDYLSDNFDPRDSRVKEIADALFAHALEPGVVEAVYHTRRIAALMDEAFALATPELRAVWKAVEWHRSGDWGSEAVAEAAAVFRSPERET